MSDSFKIPDAQASLEAAHDRPFPPDDAKALLRDCFSRFRARLFDAVRGSLDMVGDLFESTSAVSESEIEVFRAGLDEWNKRFERALTISFVKWESGVRRSGRRPDVDASADKLSVLTPFDLQMQASLVEATALFRQYTKPEQAALDRRIGQLAALAGRDADNPLGTEYILDALGVASRGAYRNSQVWRSLMVRVLSDLTPAINKIYITINRMLAGRGVLPDMKAALRARSEWRPDDDHDLLPTFKRMLAEVGTPGPDGASPEAGGGTSTATSGPTPATSADGSGGDGGVPASGAGVAPAVLAALAQLGAGTSTDDAAPADIPGEDDFPSLDPMMALGEATPLFATLGHLQKLDLPAAIAHAMPQQAQGDAAIAVPLNLVPHIRATVTEQVANSGDGISMDVIALLFDYVFRDPSIPDRQRRLFGRLQVPIVKAALLDGAFFSDGRHPARRLLDHLAEAAIGATADDAYGDAFDAAATGIVDGVCRDFEIDVSVFERADAQMAAFVEAQRRDAAPALDDDVAVALAAETREADRSHVRALLRDRLAGLDLPFEVRTFTETIWSDYLTALRKDHSADREAWQSALRILDDLLWSVEVKARTAQKAKLTKLIPGLIAGLRKGCTALTVPSDRAAAFFDALYVLHMAALKPVAESTPEATQEPAAAQPSPAADTVGQVALASVHDFVSEMAVGTWLTLGAGKDGINARLSWVSPLRTKYVFTSRTRTQAYVFSPEQLAWELGTGRAALVVEPVPLFDRAVSAALDTLAAQRPPEPPAAAAA